MKIKIKYLLIFLFTILIMFSLVSVTSCKREEPEDEAIITLKGSIWEGSELILIIYMDTRDVEGVVTFKDSNNTYDGMITKGKIDLDTYEITAECCGLWENKMYPDTSEDKCIEIRGQLSKDYKMASGMAEVWTGPNEWTARLHSIY